MHEWSLAKMFLQEAIRISREQNSGKLLEVCVQIGPLSGVEPSLLESAFDKLVAEQGAVATRLVIETTALVVRCRDCDILSEVSDFDFYCGTCQSRTVRVIQGDELKLISITVDDELDSETFVR